MKNLKTTFALATCLLASACGHAPTSQSKSATSAATGFSSLNCTSKDGSLAVTVDLQAAPNSPSIELKQNGATTSFVSSLRVIVGKSGTRLAGITWVQGNLTGSDQLNALVKSASGAEYGSYIELAGATTVLSCSAN